MPAVKLATRLFQRAPHQPWIPPAARRRFQNAAARITRLPAGVRVASEELGGIRCNRIEADGADESRAVLFLHGGAYTGGSLRTHRGIAAQFAIAAESPVHLADYRLAPPPPPPAAIRGGRR